MDTSIIMNYGDSLVYFQIMAQVAFWAYLPSMQSYYELTISLLITRMLACATVTVLSHYLSKGDGLQLSIWLVGVLGSLATGIFSFSSSGYAHKANFIDTPCQDAYNVPIRLIQASAGVYLCCLGFLFLFSIYIGCSIEKGNTEWLELERPILGYFSPAVLALRLWVLIELLLLWATYALIIMVRERGKRLFGSAYQV